jgi:hypothetical protein
MIRDLRPRCCDKPCDRVLGLAHQVSAPELAYQVGAAELAHPVGAPLKPCDKAARNCKLLGNEPNHSHGIRPRSRCNADRAARQQQLRRRAPRNLDGTLAELEVWWRLSAAVRTGRRTSRRLDVECPRQCLARSSPWSRSASTAAAAFAELEVLAGELVAARRTLDDVEPTQRLGGV